LYGNLHSGQVVSALVDSGYSVLASGFVTTAVALQNHARSVSTDGFVTFILENPSRASWVSHYAGPAQYYFTQSQLGRLWMDRVPADY
jgi:hypothetical protein